MGGIFNTWRIVWCFKSYKQFLELQWRDEHTAGTVLDLGAGDGLSWSRAEGKSPLSSGPVGCYCQVLAGKLQRVQTHPARLPIYETCRVT